VRSVLPAVLDEVEEFLTGVRPAPVAERVLATVLFTDLVGSTERARTLGERLGTTRDLVAGSGLEFEDRGSFELKGVGLRTLYAATA